MTIIRRILLSLFVAVSVTLSAQHIAVLSDIHVTPGNANETQLRLAVDEINAGNFDLVIMSGDLGNEGSDAELTNTKAILGTIRHPLCVLPGNHEDTWSQSATKTFVDIWGDDRFVTEVDSLIVIGINCGPYMKMGDGHIKQEDLHWLKATLDNLVTSGKRVLSVNHYPLLDDLDNCADYLGVLEHYPVIAHINGHYHRWGRYKAGGDECGSDLPCVTVRALDLDRTYGYTELEIDADWIHVYNKEIGKKRVAKYAFPARVEHKKAQFAARPEIVAPEGFEVTKVWSDSASVFTRLGFDADNVYFGNSLGYARAVSKKDGSLVWSVPTGASLFSRPVVLSGARVAVPMHDGILLLDAKNGKQKGKQLSKEGPYVADGMVSPDGKSYIQGSYKRIECRRNRDAKLVWSYDSIFNYCQAAPAIDGNELIFGAWDTNLRCLDLKTGKLRWYWNNGKKANMLGPGNVVPVVTSERVYIVAPDRFMTALDRATGKQLWRDNSYKYRESLGHSEDFTRIYAKTMDGELVALDATSPIFRELWMLDLGLGYEHAPCIIVEKDGFIYAGSRRGVVTIAMNDGSGLVASLPLGVSEVNGIDIDPHTGDIYVSLIEGSIFRISKH